MQMQQSDARAIKNDPDDRCFQIAYKLKKFSRSTAMQWAQCRHAGAPIASHMQHS
jgi:hypothetical protein